MSKLSTSLGYGLDDNYQEHLTDGRNKFLEWAKANAVPIRSSEHISSDNNDDLEAIAKAVGDARVVALSEGFHNCREMMQIHHRIIRYLVEHLGFNTIATESGLPESRVIFDYIQGKDGGAGESEREIIYKSGLNQMYGEWKEGRDLIEWMREFNRSHDNVLQYYGIDIGGFYQNWKAPFDQIIEYLNQVDRDYAQTLSKQLQPFLDVMTENARVRHSEMSALQQAQLQIILDSAVAQFDSKRDDYIKRSDQKEFEWARQSTVSMQFAENYYRNYLNRCQPKSSKYVGLNGREIAMHRNLMWIMEQQRTDAKIILIDHVVHTKTQTQYQDEIWGFFTPAGEMIRQSLGNDLFVIGMAYGGGEYWKGWQKPAQRVVASIPPSRENGLEQTLAALGVQKFFIHWNKAPPNTWSWLSAICSMRENDYFINIRPVEWNACIYIDKVSPATALHSFKHSAVK